MLPVLKTYIDSVPPEVAEKSEKKKVINYSDILDEYGLKYESVDYYLQVGEITWNQGWILDISVVFYQVEDLLTSVLPILRKKNIAFKIIRSVGKARSILNGELGYLQLGKIISIYPADNEQASKLAQELIDLTQSFKGPEILTDRKLNGVIFTRYGAGKPVVQVGDGGAEEQYIYNQDGQLVKESWSIPFVVPKGIPWPFSEIAPANAPKKETVLQDKYKPMYTLKSDAKGAVRKGLYLERLYRIKWCIMKEGKENMIADPEGRTVADRLQWQFDLQKDLESSIPLPKAYDLFEENGNSYFVMEYIKGVDLDRTVMSMFKNRTWPQLPLPDKLKLLDYFLRVLIIVQKMHEKGYIHRDITPGNFLVNKKDQLWMIDLELAYSTYMNKPSIPFALGTPGFMSPEQEECRTPSVEQDVYALGGLLVTLFSGILPVVFTKDNKIVLKEQLAFFIPDHGLIDIIADCFSIDPFPRPSIHFLKNEVERYRQEQVKLNSPAQVTIETSAPSKEELQNTIIAAIEGLGGPALLDKNRLWFSKANHGEELGNNMENAGAIRTSLFNGLSGILYVLARAYGMNFPIQPCIEGYEKSWDFIQQYYGQNQTGVPAGLYFGSAGVALALIEGVKSGLLPNEPQVAEDIFFLLQNENTTGNGIIKGLAGRGLTLLKAMSLLENKLLDQLLSPILEQLFQQQQKDGSWITITDKNKKELKVTGIGHGMTGITYFMMECILLNKDTKNTRQAAEKALYWLTKQASIKGKTAVWSLNNKLRLSTLNLQDGLIGIILTFLKAYEVFGKQEYREMAEAGLNNFEPYAISRDITTNSGLTGYGEMCLEGARILKSEEWKHRADWVAQFLLHHFRQEKNGSRHWLTDGTPFPIPDLMTGNSGIIHFLLRCYQPEHLGFPILS